MHTCHATGCKREVPKKMFMCKYHWFKLPMNLRNAVLRNYREGQCEDMKISHAYANSAREAVVFIAKLEGIDPDVRLYNMLDPGELQNE